MEKRFLNEKINSERVTLKKHNISLAKKMYDYVNEDRDRLSIVSTHPFFAQM